MIFSVLLALVFAVPQSTVSTPSSGGDSATIVFSFQNPQLQPASYSIEVHSDGSGHYKSTPGTASPSAASDPVSMLTPQPVDREIKIGDDLRTQLFTAARTHHNFGVKCEAAKLHVAFTGKKTLSYSGPGGQGSCTFNYSPDAQLNHIAEEMEAVSFTLEEGERMALQHQHSPLALDAELETLEDATKSGRALEIANIATQLQAIADDEAVLQRARKRAKALLGGS